MKFKVKGEKKTVFKSLVDHHSTQNHPFSVIYEFFCKDDCVGSDFVQSLQRKPEAALLR